MTTTTLRSVDLDVLNSATKYPQIPTYHKMGDRGRLGDEHIDFTGLRVYVTEKIHGTNARIVRLPDGHWLLGSREEWVYAVGDLLANPVEGIADALRPIARRLAIMPPPDDVEAIFGEVYGTGIGPGGAWYSTTGQTGFRVFDIATIPAEVLDWPRERVAAWRDHGGQQFLSVDDFAHRATVLDLRPVPDLYPIGDGAALPADHQTMLDWLHRWLPCSLARLDTSTHAERAEGVVLRTPDRALIAKARFEDYQRTLRHTGPPSVRT